MTKSNSAKSLARLGKAIKGYNQRVINNLDSRAGFSTQFRETVAPELSTLFGT